MLKINTYSTFAKKNINKVKAIILVQPEYHNCVLPIYLLEPKQSNVCATHTCVRQLIVVCCATGSYDWFQIGSQESRL